MPKHNGFERTLDVRGVKSGEGLTLGKIKTVLNRQNTGSDFGCFRLNTLNIGKIDIPNWLA